jgi:hypothetical protein
MTIDNMNRKRAMESVLSQANEAPYTELDRELVFLSIENGKYYSLKGTARRIWELLAVPTQMSGLIDTLSKEYGLDPERCAVETIPFLEKLIDAGLAKADQPRH